MRTTFLLRSALLPMLVAAVLSSGCENKVTTPTGDDSAGQGYDVYVGPLDPLGRSNYLVTLDAATTMQLTLAGVFLENPLRSVSPTLKLHIGLWDGTTCNDVTSIDAMPRLTASMQYFLTAGTHCVSVSDQLGLPETVGVIVKVVAPVITRTDSEPGTTTFASTITVDGRATRSVQASAPGVISVTLNSLSSNVVAGIGIGIPATDGRGCAVARTVNTTPGGSPQLSVPVDAGFYCVALFDVGNFTSTQNFSMTIGYP